MPYSFAIGQREVSATSSGAAIAFARACVRSRARAPGETNAIVNALAARAELGNAQKVRIAGVVQLTVWVKPAQPARQGRNPATGEAITIAKKPAGVDLRARPLAKGALPSVQKARRRIAA